MKEVPKYGSTEWYQYQYKLSLEARRGHNYAYHSEELEKTLLNKGYQWHIFDNKMDLSLDNRCTYSELKAKEVVDDYRSTGHYARIICGMEKNVQRIKTFSVIFKKKN